MQKYSNLFEAYTGIYDENQKQLENLDVYDKILEYLVSEGYDHDQSNLIMVHIVEQGMHPQEVVTRGIANLLGFDRPHPTQTFATGLRRMLFPNKPKELRVPKPPAPKLQKPQTKTPSVQKPNPYRPGATIRATGPNMDRFPELQRFADQGKKIAEPVSKTVGTIASLRKATPLGVAAAAVMNPKPTASGTRSDAPKFPTTAKEVNKGQTYYDPNTRVGTSQRFAQRKKVGSKIVGPGKVGTPAQSFDKAYAQAKQTGGMGSTFSWKGSKYKVY